MKSERSDIKTPFWRKKVDTSLLNHRGTTIPAWMCEIWAIDKLYSDVSSKKDPRSEVSIRFEVPPY